MTDLLSTTPAQNLGARVTVVGALTMDSTVLGEEIQ